MERDLFAALLPPLNRPIKRLGRHTIAAALWAIWSKLRSTNPLERFNREIGRRTDVVGIFPDDRSLIRLVSMLAIEANDCHEGRQRRRSGLSSPRRRLGARQNNRSDARR